MVDEAHAGDGDQADDAGHEPEADAAALVGLGDAEAVDGERDGRDAADVEQDDRGDPFLDGLDVHRLRLTAADHRSFPA
ncbi:hypothetical protein E0H92_36900 [Kribbella speibonae]|uniref:Uncharacterized protein n=1 Tax=Kribbella speibonae TaxID=1572660 RepID=A0A4V6N413_9ACTN|nr:hypothetical protein E0H58_11560 [Kribbella speibonae]TCC31072.1 hypothetical protein E0H92_36900 [Kribbella speibonae]